MAHILSFSWGFTTENAVTTAFVGDALKTNLARQYDARGWAEGMVLGDWSFQVGTGGYIPATPEIVIDVDPTAQTLIAPVGGKRPLGRLLSSGATAALALTATPGTVLVTGLTGMPPNAVLKWLRITGSGDPNANGTWVISRWISATSVEIANPLLLAPDAGPLTWEFRTSVVTHPNPRCSNFFSRLLSGDVNGSDLGEIGVFCRVLRSPFAPVLVGTNVLYANCHHPAIVKVPEMVLNNHVCVQA